MMRSARSLTTVRAAGGDKREAILRAAISVFAHNGYFNSKVADIAREAGVADGTVYLYFKSKEDILHSIFDRSVEDALDAARKQIEQVDGSTRKTAPDRAVASRTTRRRSRSCGCLPGRAARLDEIYGGVFSRRFCRVSRVDPLHFRRRTTRGRLSRRSERQSRGEDPFRSARRNGDELDPLQTPLQIGADGRSGAGHFSERSERRSEPRG